jgi:hypothetical protein
MEEAFRKAKVEAERAPIIPGGATFKRPELLCTLEEAPESSGSVHSVWNFRGMFSLTRPIPER